MNTFSVIIAMNCPTLAKQEKYKALEIPGIRTQDAVGEYFSFLTKASPQLAKLSKRTFARRRALARGGVLHGLYIPQCIGRAIGLMEAEIPMDVFRVHAALYSCIIIVDDILDGVLKESCISEIVAVHLGYCVENLPASQGNWLSAAEAYSAKWLAFEARLRSDASSAISSDELSAKCSLLGGTIDAFGICGANAKHLEPVYSWIDAGVCANAMADDIDDVVEDLGARSKTSFFLRLVRRKLGVSANVDLTAEDLSAALSGGELLTEYVSDLRRHLSFAARRFPNATDSGFGDFIELLGQGVKRIESDIAGDKAILRILSGARFFAST